MFRDQNVSNLPWFPAFLCQHFQTPTLTPKLSRPEGRSAWPVLQIHITAAAYPLGRMGTVLQKQVKDLIRKSNERSCNFKGLYASLYL